MALFLIAFSTSAKASGNWYEDFVYTLDSQNHKLVITALSDKGKKASELTIEATATISGVQYATILGDENQNEYNHFKFYGSNSGYNLKKITIKDGVTIHGYSYPNENPLISDGYLQCFDYFKDLNNLETLIIGNVDTTAIKRMTGLFSGCSKLTTLDLSGLDTQNVIYFSDMFRGCSSLTTITFGTFNTGNALYMSSMFEGCSSLTSLDIHGFNTAKVRSMYNMFSDCSSLATLNMSGLDVSKVEDIDDIFFRCPLVNLSLGNHSEAYVYDLTGFTGISEPCIFSGFTGKELYLPVVGLGDTDLSSCDYIYYAGNAQQWAALNNTTKATATIVFGADTTQQNDDENGDQNGNQGGDKNNTNGGQQDKNQTTTDDQTQNPVSPTNEEKKEIIDKKQVKTSVSKVKAGKKSFIVTWKKQTSNGIKGYEIQYSTNKKFKKDVEIVSIGKNKTTSKKIKGLKSGKKYYVRVRTYKISNSNRVYSKWSKTKNITVR